jgi:hypothetical protein
MRAKKKKPTVREGTIAIPKPTRSDFFQVLKNAAKPPSRRPSRPQK